LIPVDGAEMMSCITDRQFRNAVFAGIAGEGATRGSGDVAELRMTVSANAAGQRREGVQVIARASEILRQLAAAPRGLSLAELAARVGLPRSTTHRIVRALSQEDFVLVTPSGKLRVGPSLIHIAVASRRDLRHETAPFLERLSHELHETVDLGVLDGDDILFIDQYTSQRNVLRIVSEIGGRFPLYCTANGKALLAAMSDDEVDALVPSRLPKHTPATITDRHLLHEELDLVRATGVASDREEHTAGIAAVATVVRDAMGSLAAVGVVLPVARFETREREVVAALLRTRDEIQSVLSGGER
jgi:DNA-binding IclR family transcriptional regulator